MKTNCCCKLTNSIRTISSDISFRQRKRNLAKTILEIDRSTATFLLLQQGQQGQQKHKWIQSQNDDDDRSFLINVSRANNLNLPLVISFFRNIAEKQNNNICFILSQFARGNKLNAHTNHFQKAVFITEENMDTFLKRLKFRRTKFYIKEFMFPLS